MIPGIVLLFLGIAGRLIPRVVTGLSLFSVAEALGLLLVLRWFWLRRGAAAKWVRESPVGRHGAVIVAILVLIPALHLTGAVIGEIRAGKHYARIEKDLVRKDPLAALDLVVHLAREESAPLRERIVERIGEIGNPSPEVTDALRRVVREDHDRAVRGAAVRALARLLTPRDVILLLEDLSRVRGETRTLLVQVLEAGTKREFGDDPARWRTWLAETLAGAKADRVVPTALAAHRAFPGDPGIRRACLDRIRKRATGAEIRNLLSNREPAIRAAAADGARIRRPARLVSALLDALKHETDRDAARAEAEAVLALGGEEAPVRLLDVLPEDRPEAAVAAAADVICRALRIGPTRDRGRLTALLFHRGGKHRRRLLDDLVALAKTSETARAELDRIARDPAQPIWCRVGALPALTRAELEALLLAKPSPDFRQAVANELRRR